MTRSLMDKADIVRIFEEPAQWGLRGDPGLWQWLKATCEQNLQPCTAPAFMELIQGLLNEFGVSHDSDPAEMRYFEAFDKGGMSGGNISFRWWLEKGLPLLESRAVAVIAEKSI